MQTVKITTTKKLSDQQLAQVRELVEPKLGKIKIEEVIEPGIIGGITITVAGQEFDASIAGKLEKLDVEAERVVVTTAIPLSETQKKQIATFTEKSFGITEIEEVVDAAVIGGVKIRIGSREVDQTIKQKLDQLRLQLLEKI